MKDKLSDVIERCEKQGADFVEARYDKLVLRVINLDNNRVKTCKVANRTGYGVQVYKDGGVGYAFTPDIEELDDKADEALGIAKATGKAAKIKLEVERSDPIQDLNLKPDIKKPAWELETAERFEYIKRFESAAEDATDEIKSKTSLYGELSGEKYFTNSDGTEISWFPALLEIRLILTGKTEGGDLVSVSHSHAGTTGLEIYDTKKYSLEKMGGEVAEWLEEKIEGKPSPAGQHRALTGNNLSGVLAHETFGHLTEADFIASGSSPLSEKLNEKIGSETATIVDTGTIDDRSGEEILPFYLPYDDEGTKTSKKVLLDNGVATGFLTSKSTAPLTDTGEITGNARAIDFAYAPIPRMRNTYFESGDIRSEEEALEVLDEGIYAKGVGGGQTSFTGNFQFTTRRAYWVENGEIQYPLRDVTITGDVMNFLQNIEASTSDFQINASYFGGCGKRGQGPLPVGVGGPKLILSNARFGGRT